MADTTTPMTPPAQDLQINLEDAPKESTAAIVTEPGNTQPELDLSMDLNLPEAPKNDDRLKAEDQNNMTEKEKPTTETTEVAKANEPIIEDTLEENFASMEPITDPVTGQPVENLPEINDGEIVHEETPPKSPIEQKDEEPVVKQPSTTVTEEPITAAAPTELKNDMKIIEELEGHGSAGGLSQEAMVTPQPKPSEAPKTFDLDAMLGGPATPPVIEATQPAQQANIEMPIPNNTSTPIETPPFGIPTTTTQMPVQGVMQTTIPQNKNKGIKTLLFVVLFVALGFTTFFILKTMYPIEFGNIFNNQTNMHASEVTTGAAEELTGTELTGTDIAIEETSGDVDIGSGTHDSAVDNGFGELNDLGSTTEPSPQTDVSRLTDYVTQGNSFLAQGKAISNNTVIKYGLYISKKATSFLEKIANGEEINNLSGYFAQFDQYIEQLKVLLGQTPETDVEETSAQQEVSTTPPANVFEEMTPSTSSPAPEATTE